MKSTSRSRSWALIVSALAAAVGLGCESPDDVAATPAAVGPGGVGNVKPVCPPECDDGNPCTSDTCDALGRCHHAAVPNGTTCSDGNVCTQADSCQNGICVGVNAPNGTSCNDGNACTQTDTCQTGACVGGNPVICTALDQCHVAGTCDPATGACSNPDATDGTSCNDDDACTQTDACLSGVCVGGNPVVCTALDQCHDAGTCDHATGVCSDPPKPNGTSCSDGDACTQTDTCQAGACVGANPVLCSALDQCHVAGTCDHATGVCSNPAKADGTACDDGNLCTQTDVCQGGTCTGGNPVVCAASDQCHDVGTCDVATGQCSNPVKADGTSCDDGDACTTADACQGGACTGGAPLDCSDGDACTVDNCDSQTGCFHEAVVCANAGVNNCSGVCSGGCSTTICSTSTLGCGIGYWKNHTDTWSAYVTSDLVVSVFAEAKAYVNDKNTLLDALAYHGGKSLDGGARNLLRQAVAALLNATDPTIGQSSPWPDHDIVLEVNAALASKDRAVMITLAEELESYNSAEGGGCPLN